MLRVVVSRHGVSAIISTKLDSCHVLFDLHLVALMGRSFGRALRLYQSSLWPYKSHKILFSVTYIAVIKENDCVS
jgi:hypothetical protein